MENPRNHCNNHGDLRPIAPLPGENYHPVNLHQNLYPASTGQLHYAAFPSISDFKSHVSLVPPSFFMMFLRFSIVFL